MGLLNRKVEVKQTVFELELGKHRWAYQSYENIEACIKEVFDEKGIGSKVEKNEYIVLRGLDLDTNQKYNLYLFETNMDYIIPDMLAQSGAEIESTELDAVLGAMLGYTFDIWAVCERGRDNVIRTNTYFKDKLSKGGIA